MAEKGGSFGVEACRKLAILGSLNERKLIRGIIMANGSGMIRRSPKVAFHAELLIQVPTAKEDQGNEMKTKEFDTQP